MSRGGIKSYRLGELGISNQGYLMKIIEYKNARNIIVEFQDDYKYTVKTNYCAFRDGIVKNHFHKKTHNFGLIGNTSTVDCNNKLKTSYRVWASMILRCHDDSFTAYIGCSICNDWLIYENFEKWYDKNYWECGKEKMQLDKDILIKGNRTYSPNACIFVPQRINTLFVKSNKSRGKYMIGVTFNKRINRFVSQCSYIKVEEKAVKTNVIGNFSTELEAFNAYKQFKESYIKQVADDYANKYPNFPKRLYDAMYNYEVEITD